jgi:L,D-transpeptidase catalytic domain
MAMRVAFLVVLALAAAGCGAEEQSADPAAPFPPPPPQAVEPPPRPAAKPRPQPASIVEGDKPAKRASPKRTSPREPAEPHKQGRPAGLGYGPCAGDEPALGGKRLAYATVAERGTVAYDEPGGDPLERFGVRNENGHAMVFGVRRVVLNGDCKIEWYRVWLPMRPNGSEGYVHADDVRLVRRDRRITIDLSERELVLHREGEPVLRSPVAVGAPGTPTPTGRYYVNQRLIAPDPDGPWGPGALGISAFSDVLQEWIQGGPIGIHGTNDPSSIGRPVSHGCVRLPNHVLMKVFNAADAGTPVIIHA